MIGADPEGSIYSSPANVHGYDIEGVGEDFYPSAFDQTIPDAVEQVTDGEAFLMTRRLAARGRASCGRFERYGGGGGRPVCPGARP